MAFDIYISNIFRSYILHNGFLIKPKNSTLLISSHEPSPLMKQGTNMMYGCKEPHDAWMGIISIDRYQPCLPHPLWSFNNPSNNNVKYRICDISYMWYLTLQNAYAINRIRNTFSRTLALCLGSGYFEHTINNAYAILICTSEVRFWFPKWHQKVEPTSCEHPL